MKAIALLILLCAAGSAHTISMSSGYATLSGNRVEYVLRMPGYEAPRVPGALLDHIRFRGGFENGRRTSGDCHLAPAEGNMVCIATFEFSRPVTELGVECTFFEVTVPNHIHILHAIWGEKRDQAILDSTFPSATLRFRPPTALEQAVTEVWQSAKRVQWILLLAIVAAARGRRELWTLAVAFLGAQWAVALLDWHPNAQFADAAAGVALAYLAFEILAFPNSGARWLMALCLGAFSGLYFGAFALDSGFRTWWVLLGSTAAAALVFGIASIRLLPARIARWAGAPLFIAGCWWFLQSML